jgi:kinesin family protein 4/21/27
VVTQLILVLRIRPSDPDDASVPPRFRHVLVHPTSTSDVRVDVDPSALAGQAIGTGSTGSVKKHPTFNFDHVLPEDATQTALYDAAASGVIDDFMKGHNVTFLA